MIDRGNTNQASFVWKKPAGNLKNYALAVQYVWGGRVKELNYEIPLQENQLMINVKQPARIVPGQEVEFEVQVTDYKGTPVKNADVLAYGLTSKFGTSSPSVEYFNSTRKSRKAYNKFSWENKYRATNRDFDLEDFDRWNALATLDTIPRYQFLYPDTGIYRFEYPMTDSIRQVAPFVMHKGKLQTVHVIEIDNLPVYFSWASQDRPYSFRPSRVDIQKYHEIRLRTADKEIIIDSVYIPVGKKVIISIDDTRCRNKHVRIFEAKPELTKNERARWYGYTAKYKGYFPNTYTYFQQRSTIIPVKQSGFIGPISPSKLEFTALDSFSISFRHEPFYTYEPSDKLLKMRSFENRHLPRSLGGYTYKPLLRTNLKDTVLTLAAYKKQYKAYLENRKRKIYTYPTVEEETYYSGRLRILLEGFDKEQKPKNILLMKLDDISFLRVWRGYKRSFPNLQAGQYKMIFMLPNEQYFVVDSITIQSRGLNCLRIHKPDSFKSDDFSKDFKVIMDEYEEKYGGYRVNGKLWKSSSNRIRDSYRKELTPRDLEGAILTTGVLKDEKGEPLPGATVLVKGTTHGTVTDVNGQYSLQVPNGNSILVFSYVGFETQEIVSAGQSQIDIKLEQAGVLEEVVVTSYGLERETKRLGSSVAVVKSDALMGNVTGLNIGGAGGNIKIRGMSGLKGKGTPLIVLDGVIYEGDLKEIDPALIKDANVLNGAAATGLYGARGANGVLVITSKNGVLSKTLLKKGNGVLPFEDDEEPITINSIRSDFRDDAYWQPTLTTNDQGIAKFMVKFPDDITKWNTYVLAVGGRRQTGSFSGQIKSYKPLLAQLAVPRFLVVGDTAMGIGKSVNYGPVPEKIERFYELEGQQLWSKSGICADALIDTLMMTTSSTDSLSAQYSLKKENGYLDGEKRDIPVLPVGFERSEGQFFLLLEDTSFSMSTFDQGGTITLRAENDVLDIAETAVSRLRVYGYYCNEQLASKLQGFLTNRLILPVQRGGI